jgi:hypothetical protein
MKKLPVIALFLLMPLIASAWWPSATDVTNIVNSFGFLTTIPPNTNGIPPGMVTNNAPATITVTNNGVSTVIKTNGVTTPSLVSQSVVTTNLTVSGTFSAAVPTTLLSGSNFLNGIALNQQGVDTVVLGSSGSYLGAIGNPSPQVWGLGVTLTPAPLSASWVPVLDWYLGGVSVLGNLQVSANTGSPLAVLSQSSYGSYAALGLSTPGGSWNISADNSGTKLYFATGLNLGSGQLMTIQSGGGVGIGTMNPASQLDVNGSGLFESNLFVSGAAVVTNSLYVGRGLITNGCQLDVNGSGLFETNLFVSGAAVVTNSLYVGRGLITNGFMVFSSTTNIQVPVADTNHIWIATQTNRPGYIFILSNTVWMPK